jgi:hypothetical protein
MNIVDLKSWQDFLGELERLQADIATRRDTAPYVSPLLFRGHANAVWRLETTLERVEPQRRKLTDYYQVVSRIRHEAETFTGTEWDVPTPDRYREWAGKTDLHPGEYPAYEYLLWLRHYGFPSPLLDWTRSAFIAAYFAFGYPEASAAERVGIYAFLEYSKGGKVWTKTEPHIMGLGPYVKGHRRHFLQQSEYTICVAYDEGWKYASHESVFSLGGEEQDLLWKFTIPSSERATALRYLEQFNITGYSLYGSDESLFHTLALREFLIRRRI